MAARQSDERKHAMERATIGLCASCRNVRRIVSAKGSEFIRCEAAASDPSLLAYPPLPVRACAAYAVAEAAEERD